MTKPTKWVCAQRILRSAWASALSDQSSLSAWRKLVSLATHWAHSENSDQTGRMPTLIWVFAGRTVIFFFLFYHEAAHISPLWTLILLPMSVTSYEIRYSFMVTAADGHLCYLSVIITRKQFLELAPSWENVFLPYANSKCVDQSAHPRIRAVWSAPFLCAAWIV